MPGGESQRLNDGPGIALHSAPVTQRTCSVAGELVSALTFEEARTARVTGVQVGADMHQADLVVDASGRRSPVPDWLTAAGCRPPVVDSHRTGIAYLCRWYRLRADGPRDPGRVKTGSAAPFALAGVFPSDNDTFAVSLVLSTGDPTRGALTDPAVFEAVARRFPATAAWLDLAPEPQTAVLAMAGLDNRWTSLVDGDGPVVRGLVNAGDSLVHTNPTLGHGVALGLLAAQHLATHVDQVAADPIGYHTWTAQVLRPWFDAQVTADRGNEQRLTESSPSSDRRAAALAACAFEIPSSCEPEPKYAISCDRPTTPTAQTKWTEPSPTGWPPTQTSRQRTTARPDPRPVGCTHRERGPGPIRAICAYHPPHHGAAHARVNQGSRQLPPPESAVRCHRTLTSCHRG